MQSASIDLSQPRVVVLRHGEKKFTYRFRRITDADWKKYYAGISHVTEVVNNDQVREFDLRTALQSLVEATLEHVEGYTGPGGVSLEQIENWKLKLPIGHKISAGLTLANVGPDQSAAEKDISQICDLTEVSLSAAWSADENGQMFRLDGLIHRFRHPSIDQLRRFNRESSRTRVVGGSRTGKTIWPGQQAILAEFYDELIAEVDGYRWQALELDKQPEEIKRHMDMQHKVAAAQILFSDGAEAEIQFAETVEQA